MKLTAETKELKNLIESVVGVVPNRGDIPVYTGLLLIAEDNKVSVTAMDNTVSVRNIGDASVEEVGRILVPAEKVKDIVKNAQGETINFRTEGNTVKISSGNTVYSLPLMNPNDFPEFPYNGKVEKELKLPMDEFVRMSKQTMFACSTESARPLFQGVLCHIHDGKACFVGTDTHRIAIADTPTDCTDIYTVIPAKYINLTQKLFSDGEITIGTIGNRAVLSCENWTLVCTIIAGQFPDYRRIIETNQPCTITADKDELLGAVKRVCLCTSDDLVPVRFLAVNDKLQVSTKDTTYGTAEDTVDVTIKGEPVNIAFRGKSLIEGLSALKGDTVSLRVKASLAPVAMTDTENDNFLYILTPMRVIF